MIQGSFLGEFSPDVELKQWPERERAFWKSLSSQSSPDVTQLLNSFPLVLWIMDDHNFGEILCPHLNHFLSDENQSHKNMRESVTCSSKKSILSSVFFSWASFKVLSPSQTVRFSRAHNPKTCECLCSEIKALPLWIKIDPTCSNVIWIIDWSWLLNLKERKKITNKSQKVPLFKSKFNFSCCSLNWWIFFYTLFRSLTSPPSSQMYCVFPPGDDNIHIITIVGRQSKKRLSHILSLSIYTYKSRSLAQIRPLISIEEEDDDEKCSDQIQYVVPSCIRWTSFRVKCRCCCC